MYGSRNKIVSVLAIIVLIISLVTNIFVIGPMVMIGSANPGNEPESWYNTTQLNVTVLQLEPRISWFDFQHNNSGTWESKLDEQIDVNEEYRFIINVSSDQGWPEIEFINISCWHDRNNDSVEYNYNDTVGGNINLLLQYENTTATGNVGVFRMRWPDDEVTFNSGDSNETNVTGTDPVGVSGDTNTYNLTFAFTPDYQFRYARDPTNTAAGFNDKWSWNFNITVDDSAGYHSYDNPTIGESIGEFGVFSYSSITTAGWPTIIGSPGGIRSTTDAGGSGNISITTISNANYSLAANVTNLTHKVDSQYYIQNTSIYTRGGDLDALSVFTGSAPLYYYPSTYKYAMNDSTSLTTTDVEWAVNIILGQQPGEYDATIYYHLRSETD
ncbi:MAG: hypothetical protein JSW62_04345 [Thermoplasmatales archaeon]|nr:MAG: hypothetical protein JSW62_04345 [Thermoplasmatales archaeon]